MATNSLPPTHKALVQEVYAGPLVVKTLPTPQPTPGSAIIKIIHVPIVSYIRDVYNGKRKYPYPTPLVPGTSAIARVVATGPDAVVLKEGDLVYFDSLIRGRDDSDAIVLQGISEGGSPGSTKLMAGEWRDSTFAEYAKVPLENVFQLNEKVLCGSPEEGGLGYQPAQLCWFLQALASYGGLRSIGLQAGETVIVAPATGAFSGAAVVCALALGARVIAMGRNVESLAKLKALGPRVETVQISGNEETDLANLKKFGKIDAYIDISPPQAAGSSHFKAAIHSLGQDGRVSLMGGLLGDVGIPHRHIMRHDITIKGKWMYNRADCLAMIKLFTTGVLDARHIAKVMADFKLENWEEAFETAFEKAGKPGQLVVFSP
ncbi:alcohol dehydrogenase [Xylariaceae sp. FL1272]|nr:alcohol dehydrogenase [Xylariaceae sp. FL1272]